jgi:hypothetical protein
VHLEDRLGDIQTDRNNLTHGAPPDRRRPRSRSGGAPSTASDADLPRTHQPRPRELAGAA